MPTRRESRFDWLDVLHFVLVCLASVAVCPFTKVEESFNVQATHDLIYHPHDLSQVRGDCHHSDESPSRLIASGFVAQFDHFEFPGVVPRTFLGPIVLSTLALPIRIVVHWIFELISTVGVASWLPLLLSHEKLVMLLVVRCLLGLLYSGAIVHLRMSIRRTFGSATATFFMLVSLSQFHLNFYATRPLPNTFALVISNCIPPQIFSLHFLISSRSR